MRYTKFRFKNFKGIDDLEISLTGDVTTLVGLNESGKTTILEAIFCFSYGSENMDAINPGLESLRDPEQWIPISQRANFNEPILISATVSLDKADKASLKAHMKREHSLTLTDVPDEITIKEQYKFSNSRSDGASRVWDLTIQGLKGQQRNTRKYGAGSDEWQGAVAHLKQALPRIWYFPNFLFELPERFVLTGLDSLDDEERDRSTFYRAIFEQVLGEQANDANLATHVVDRLDSKERADKRSLEAVLLGMSRSITNTIFDGWNRIFGRAPIAQEVQIQADLENSAAYLELQIKGPDGYYDLSERSLGFRWFFMFLLMTSFSGTRTGKEEQRPLFLLDEPASNLHSSAQAELLKSFETLTERCSLVYTTHSHHLINLRWLDSAYVVKNEALGSLAFDEYFNAQVGAKTSISAAPYRRFVNDNPTQTSYFQPVLDLLDYRPSNLEPIPHAVLVEGKSDFYLLRYAHEVLGVGDRCPAIVPGTGAGTLAPAIGLYIGWAKPFILLLDGDKAGREQLERYQSLFEPALAGRHALLPELCGDETAIEAESLLSEVDRRMIVEHVFPDESTRPSAKKAVSQGVMELYASNDKVELEPSTVERLERLFDSLQQMLDEQSKQAPNSDPS
ncbi:ATP-dependent nuclease [Aeromicrobium sp. CF3.5]|uniref:ATP-dependent nuclease n=1 Tax=Aeromicrobium sp. CF3.5 TaxID=3373078 RepID=UPI003EE4D995